MINEEPPIMSEDDFWFLIKSAREYAIKSDISFLKGLHEALKVCYPVELICYENRFQRLFAQLTTSKQKTFWYDIMHKKSSDQFDFTVFHIIASGKSKYEHALEYPKDLYHYQDLEVFSYYAMNVFEELTRKAMDPKDLDTVIPGKESGAGIYQISLKSEMNTNNRLLIGGASNLRARMTQLLKGQSHSAGLKLLQNEDLTNIISTFALDQNYKSFEEQLLNSHTIKYT